MIGQCIGPLNYSLYICLSFHLSFLFSLSLSLSFLPPDVSPFLSLLPWFLCLNLVVWLSLHLCPVLHLSLPPLSHSFSLSLSLALLPLILPHISLPLLLYLSISPLNSWFKDCFSHPSTSGGRGQEFTGARMSFSAVCLWSKAPSTVKAHPSVIHNILQSLENGHHCGYSA